MSGLIRTTVPDLIQGATEDGKMPMQTSLDSKQIVEAKVLDRQYEDKMEEETENEMEYREPPPTSKTNLTPIVSVR